MKVRGFFREDLPAVLDIQAKCPQAGVWKEKDYLQLADNPGGMILIAEQETTAPSKALGFAALHRVLDEAELRNIAVDPAHQRRGLGRALLEEAKRRLLTEGVKRIYLEVRASNQPALELYLSLGFGVLSRRQQYYQNPDEDALVLELKLVLPAAARCIG
jgi:ribosomal-protein-alanine N-acetyltransferase